MKRSQIKIGSLYQVEIVCKLQIWNTEPSWYIHDILDGSEIIGVIDGGDCFVVLELLPITGSRKYIDMKVLSHEGITGWVSTDLSFFKTA